MPSFLPLSFSVIYSPPLPHAVTDFSYIPAGTATVDVLVLDTNDSPPRFTKSFWKAEVEESVEPSIPNRTILNVTVLDDDETNNFYFEIPEAYEVASDMFIIEAIGDGIGAIRLAKPLDFEDPSQRLGFEFQIVVSDVGEVAAEAHTASAWVEIRIKDVNDNAPVFKEDSIEVNVSEKMIIGSAISTFVATDVDNEGRGKISYTIDPKSDKMGHFSVSSEGTVKLRRPLDRETIPRHLILIKASDEGIPQKTSTANLTVNVLDENDNAPRFSRAYFPILPENQPSRKLIEVSAVDDDDATRGNGPPFHFALDISSSTAEIQALFSVEHNATGDNGQGAAVVSSLGSFDREMRKEYHLPIVIVDSGHPPMTGTSTLVITIGDENDNLMRPGEKRVSVYTHKSISQETQIGRIYVHDPDDWDLVDKTFNWSGKPHPNFILDEDSGMITMLAATRSGEYLLEFLVQDHKHSQNNVKANVTVSVIYIPERVVQQAASLRIANITDEFFIQTWYNPANDSVPSKADLFRREISEMVNTDADNVHIFSLKLSKSRPPVTDVRFTVFDGHYFEAGLLSALVMEQKNDIETKLGISIIMIGINECLDESVPCDGSCTSNLVISDEPYLVDANRTSVVSVNVNVIPECACQAIDFSIANVKKQTACRPKPCKNRGKCIREKDGTHCVCPKGLQGPRCQMLTMTFEGNGYSWFPSLATCDKNHISVEFVTVRKHGLIFYNDALTFSREKGHFTSDFILLEIENGQLRFLTDYGSGTIQLRVNGTGNLADGRWHRVDLFLETRSISVEVDHCMTAIVQEPHEQLKGMFDTSSCRAESQVPPYSRYLNLNGPLQVGGIRHYSFQRNPKNTFTPSVQPFSGCIRNLMLNGHFYDFSQPLLHNNTSWKCKPFEEICRGNKGTESNDSFESCSHGTCEGSFHHPVCVCDPGWTGTTCSERTVPAYFGNVSYVKYALSFKPNTYSMNIQLRFRTWELAGVLLHVANQYNQEFGTLQIEDSRLLFRFNTNSHSKEEQIVQLSHVNVSDGEWHLAAVARIGVIVILSLDEGDGNWYNESYRSDSSHLLIDVDLQEGVVVGGKVRYSGVDHLTVDEDYRQGLLYFSKR
ncbi:neural-cadherin-like [Macrobrachium nipponense]|uniref:neural-cadherin-like n=1 Tax=Macrobrachium nipponense TaxID=159736 RepID=UPI0030C7BC87